ncbi:riboflavin aldehydeforming enzyme [Mucor ambiguus]|uniref:Riboflavin aldehydeforming enzyme n=1 Tax=Mucor ambiguus TaxID=91626 RepID=A0A0C9MFX7_9FUNG|nr:riboflavin aldehydeforming enzyme [Mucor ambiguus]
MVSTRFYTTTFFLVITINHFLFVSTAPLERRIIRASKLLEGVEGKLFSGSGTYYKVGSGSCGERDTDNELVVAMNKAQMDNGSNPNSNPKCDKMVSITGDIGTVTARVVDTCPACANGALDMSPTTFKRVCGDLAEGVCNISWKFL